MANDWRHTLSRSVGWLTDRRIPEPLRAPIYGAYCRFTGADASEAQLPYRGYASLGAFFVRRLQPGARPLESDGHTLISPCDGTIQRIDPIEDGTLLQAKGSTYTVAELLAGADAETPVEGGHAWTIYLSPRDYHRVHAPEDSRLHEVRWVAGHRHSVAPGVLERRERVLSTNERAVLRLESERGPYFLVMVGALNVGRIRVVGVEHGTSPDAPLPFERGAELARFEMGSTVVLVYPRGSATPLAGLEPGTPVRLGNALGRFAR